MFSNPDSLNLKKSRVTKFVFQNVNLVHIGMIGETVARVSSVLVQPSIMSVKSP